MGKPIKVAGGWVVDGVFFDAISKALEHQRKKEESREFRAKLEQVCKLDPLSQLKLFE